MSSSTPEILHCLPLEMCTKMGTCRGCARERYGRSTRLITYPDALYLYRLPPTHRRSWGYIHAGIQTNSDVLRMSPPGQQQTRSISNFFFAIMCIFARMHIIRPARTHRPATLKQCRKLAQIHTRRVCHCLATYTFLTASNISAPLAT